MSPKLPSKIRAFVVHDGSRPKPRIEAVLETFRDLHVVGRATDPPDIAARVAAVRPDVVFIECDGDARCSSAMVRSISEQALPVFVFVGDSAEPSSVSIEAEVLLMRLDAREVANALTRIRTMLLESATARRRARPIALKPGLY